MLSSLLYPSIGAWFLAIAVCIYQAQRITSIKLISLLSFVTGLLTIFYFVADYFTGQGINQAVVFHTMYGVEGAGFLQYLDLICWSVAGVIFISVLSYGVVRWVRLKKQSIPDGLSSKAPKNKLVTNVLAYSLMLFSITAHPAVRDAVDLYLEHKYGFSLESKLAIQRLRDINYSTLTSKELSKYLEPIKYTHNGRSKKNIVYLYVEGLEHTFFDQKLFPGLINELRTLERESTSFSNIKQAELTGWTIAGMTASQCAVPLYGFPHKDPAAEERMIPGSTCLGDILQKEGYYLAYMGGADLKFSKKGKFYSEHGFNDVMGLAELKPTLPPDLPTSHWGLYDDTFLDLLYKKYIKLSKRARPFGLFAITLDTHSPEGHETPACKGIQYQDGSNKLLNAVHCADLLITKFIQSIRNSPYAKNTIIVVGSDHLFMNKNSSVVLAQQILENRRDLLMIFDPDLHLQSVEKAGTTLDIAPTVLSLAGFETKGMALGRNLLGPEPTLLEAMGYEQLNSNIYVWDRSILDAESTKIAAVN